MIVKRNLNLIKAIPYVWFELSLALAVSLTVFLIYHVGNVELIAIPNVLPATLGVALAIFLGFRNSAAYGRWNEAAGAWKGIANFSRTFGRLIITFVHSHKHTPSYDAEKARIFKQEMIYRHIAWVHVLRLQLRRESDWSVLKPTLNENDFHIVKSKSNKLTAIQVVQGYCIYEAMASGTLQGFDSFQLEGALAQLSALATKCEQLKHIPIPRQYTFFTRLFVWFWILILPFSYIRIFAETSREWVVIPVTVMLAFVFGIIERTGAVNEEPFENKITDVPITAIAAEIERDLREMLDEPDLPPKMEPQKGFLF